MTVPIRPSADWYPTRRPPRAGGRLLHWAVLGFSLFLLVRTVAVEPFGVPTGSMAPTLLGARRSAACPRCDHPIEVGEPGPEARPLDWSRCRCPNCALMVDMTAAPTLPGDRLLVDKTAFQHRPPRRWEVAVFDTPADRSKPYVKRIVGLPGEFVQVIDGDVTADGELCRKTLTQVRGVMVPVFDQHFAPDGGWGKRWALTNAEFQGGELVLTAGGSAAYRHHSVDADRDEPVDGWLTYNGGPAERRGSFGKLGRGDQAHDFIAAFDLTVTAADPSNLNVVLRDGADAVTASICLSDESAWKFGHRIDTPAHIHPGSGACRTGRTYRIEAAFVDRRVSLAVDGVEVVPAADLPPAVGRRGVTDPLTLAHTGRGSVVVRNLRLFRDIHYLPFGVAAAGHRLGPSEYFALGDNTANSHDSRTWQVAGRPAPGVPATGLVGKPFLIHQPMRLHRSPVGGTVRGLDWDRLRLLR